jgi:DNA polymerase V
MSRVPRLFSRFKLDLHDETILREIRESGLHAGFPSPAEDYQQHRINLTRELVPNPDYTEIVEVYGDCCIDRGILDPCRLLIDFTEFPTSGDLVYVRYGDEDMIRVYTVEFGKVVLRTANAKKRYPAIVLSEVEGLEIRGVVIHILIDPRKRLLR